MQTSLVLCWHRCFLIEHFVVCYNVNKHSAKRWYKIAEALLLSVPACLRTGQVYVLHTKKTIKKETLLK